MKATLRNVSGSYGQSGSGAITFARDELTPKFSGNFLIMEKVLGGGDCNRVDVDGVAVCTEVAETVTLQCKYSLADQTIDDTFDVTGQDTTATAEGTGSLDYTLVVEDNKAIGDTVKFTITPVNSGLVFATVKSCDVTHDNGDALTIVGHGSEHCTNPVVNAAALTNRFTSNAVIEGTWKAFKWSTATTDNVESQGLSCKIGLSENASTDDIEDCTQSNAAEAGEGESEEAGEGESEEAGEAEEGGEAGDADAGEAGDADDVSDPTCVDNMAGLYGVQCAAWASSCSSVREVQQNCPATCGQC